MKSDSDGVIKSNSLKSLMKSDHAVVNLKFYKIASINCEKFDFTKDTSEGFYKSGEESDYYRVMSSSELGLMKSDHSVVFNEFRY